MQQEGQVNHAGRENSCRCSSRNYATSRYKYAHIMSTSLVEAAPFSAASMPTPDNACATGNALHAYCLHWRPTLTEDHARQADSSAEDLVNHCTVHDSLVRTLVGNAPHPGSHGQVLRNISHRACSFSTCYAWCPATSAAPNDLSRLDRSRQTASLHPHRWRLYVRNLEAKASRTRPNNACYSSSAWHSVPGIRRLVLGSG